MPKYQKYDRGGDVAYACGVFPCMELYQQRPNDIRALLIKPDSYKSEGVKKLIDECRAKGIRIEEAPKAMERISGKENCYAIFAFSKYACRLNADRPHLVLHNISDMGNFGTIVRTCLGFGFKDIALIRPCVDMFDPKAVRASMGAVFSVDIQYFDNFDDYRKLYPDHSTYFFRLRNAASIFETEVSGLPALVFGNEGSGLPKELEIPDTGVIIPHSDKIDSLNLSVAVGIGTSYFAQKLIMK